MGLGEAQVLWRMIRGQPRDGTLQERLTAFYGPQAEYYDAFRERLLHGRAELMARLAPPPGAKVIELGAGTGRNLGFLSGRLSTLESVDLVDLCPALLEQARRRTQGLPNVRVVEADALTYRPGYLVDLVYFSYSLTMIPDWEGALRNALALLKPGGVLGVVDFYVSERNPPPGLVRHGALTRWFWPRWFAHDGVRLHPSHLRTLRRLLPDHDLTEQRAPVPYLPGLRVPYYLFVGRAGSGRARRRSRDLPGNRPRYLSPDAHRRNRAACRSRRRHCRNSGSRRFPRNRRMALRTRSGPPECSEKRPRRYPRHNSDAEAVTLTRFDPAGANRSSPRKPRHDLGEEPASI